MKVHFGDNSDWPIEFQAEILTSTRIPVDKPVLDQLKDRKSVTSCVKNVPVYPTS